MANSYVTYTGNGSTTAYSVPFQYLSQSHVKVYLNNVLTTNYTWTASNIITFTTAPSVGQTITVRRQTPSASLVDFTAKARWQTTDLNTAIRQALYLAEESEEWSPSWLSGSGAPATSVGIEGDFYIDTASGDLYRKGVSSWTLLRSIIGPTGATGPTGPQGAQGIPGLTGSGTGDMLATIYDTNSDGKVNAADAADSVPWTGVTGKPSTFTPSAHNHATSEVTGLDTALAGKQPIDADLTAIGALAGTSGLLKKTAANTWSLDTVTYAPLASPTFTGTPAAPSATRYATGTQIATVQQVYDTVTNVPQNAQTGTTYTLVATDRGKMVTLTNAAAITLTINNSIFTAGDRVDIAQGGAGQVTVAAGSGVTIKSSGSKLKLSGQYSGATIWFESAAIAWLLGDITT